MTYKKKLIVLSGIVAVLAIVYILTIIFDPERVGLRSDAYSWLEPRQKDRIDRITITNTYDTIMLVHKGGEWFVSQDGIDYPARQARVEDFIGMLCRKAPYPVRSSTAASHERLSVTDASTQVVIGGGAGLPLLHLYIGQGDLTGRNIYLRKQGENEVRSGEDIFTVYTDSLVTSWYNLLLFPETESGKLSAADIQRLTVYPPEKEHEQPPYIFTRRDREWIITGIELNEPDTGRVDNYVRDILNGSGDEFGGLVGTSGLSYDDSRIVLELGDGSIKTIRLGAPDENGRRFATVSGSSYVHSIPGWAYLRLFPDPSVFER